jgi:lipopolysaccharide transport system permease protein
MNHNTTEWLFEITPKTISFRSQEVWQYRDLLMLFVKRDVVTVYKQTVLGPLVFDTTLVYLHYFYYYF